MPVVVEAGGGSSSWQGDDAGDHEAAACFRRAAEVDRSGPGRQPGAWTADEVSGDLWTSRATSRTRRVCAHASSRSAAVAVNSFVTDPDGYRDAVVTDDPVERSSHPAAEAIVVPSLSVAATESETLKSFE